MDKDSEKKGKSTGKAMSEVNLSELLVNYLVLRRVRQNCTENSFWLTH